MTSPRIVVAGAGVAGLAAAFTIKTEAAKRGAAIELTLLDAAEAGGHARTIAEDGFLVERGPNGFLDRGTETMALIDELQLQDRIVEANPYARRRFILRDGTLRRVPDSPPALIASDAISWQGKLRLLREPWAASPPAGTDETIFAFAERRLGLEAAETLVDTAVAGISAGDSRVLSVRSQFPTLVDMEREHGSLLKAMLARQRSGARRPRLLSFDRGMSTLTATLASRLGGVLREKTSIEQIEKLDHGWRIQCAEGSSIAADHVVLALPAHRAAHVARGFDDNLAAAVASIPYAGLSVVALAYRADAIARPLDGYGYLVTRQQELSTLGVLWESSIFPHRAPADHVLLRVMLGGARRPEVSAFGDRMLVDVATREAAQVLGIRGRPLHQWVCRWPSAIAQYTVGHDARVAGIRQLVSRHRGLHICGTAVDGVSLNDAVASARSAARALLQEIES